MRQRDGPLCPCCRRDFVIDPFDLQDVAVDEEAAAGATRTENATGTLEDVAETGRGPEERIVAPAAILWEASDDGLDREEGQMHQP